MGAIDDLEVQLMCTGFEGDQRREPETIKFFMSCNDTSKSSARFSFGCNYKSLNTTTRHWDVISTMSKLRNEKLKSLMKCSFAEYDDCQPANFWSSVHIVNYVPDLYAVLWGCRNLTNNQNEQGAWILGYKDNFSLAAKMLDQALTVDLKFAEVPTRDFVLHNQTYSGNATACSHKLCEYNLLCKNDAEDSKEIE